MTEKETCSTLNELRYNMDITREKYTNAAAEQKDPEMQKMFRTGAMIMESLIFVYDKTIEKVCINDVKK